MVASDLLVFVGNALFEAVEVEGVPDVLDIDLVKTSVRGHASHRIAKTSRPWL